MRVVGVNGTTFALTPLRYEFPDHLPEGSSDHDANWLVMKGAVDQSGDEWTFQDACLTTWDCKSLADWLDAVATGAVAPVEFDPTPDWWDDPRMRSFDEPVVAFSLASCDAVSAAVRVHLSLEALPPWLRAYEDVDIFEFFVVVEVGLRVWADAAKALRQDIEAFPPR